MSSEEQIKRTRKNSGKAEEEVQMPMPQIQPPQVSEEQKKFLDALNNLIFNVQELAYAVALVPEDVVNKYPELQDLMSSAKDVIRSAYNFHKLVKAGVTKQ